MMNFEKISLLIIAGGKSSRLGHDKRFVEVGGIGLLENILKKSAENNFAEIFLCTENLFHEKIISAKKSEKINPAIKKLAEKYNAKILIDEIKNAGPLAGLAHGLAKIKNNWALAISADMPFFEFNFLESLKIYFENFFSVIPISNGRKQMLAGFYHKSAAKIFNRELLSGQRKIFDSVKKIPHKFIEIPTSEEIFFNVNTPADLRLARGRAENFCRRIPIISIVAPSSGTGKTTFIEKILSRLESENIKVGVIKSDAHGFNLDTKGKDSWKFQQAGARSVAVVSPASWFMIQKTDEREDFLNVAEKMSDVDLILTESRTHATFPALSLWRGKGEVIVDEKIVAIFTSDPQNSTEIFNFDLNDIDAALKICKFLSAKNKLT